MVGMATIWSYGAIALVFIGIISIATGNSGFESTITGIFTGLGVWTGIMGVIMGIGYFADN